MLSCTFYIARVQFGNVQMYVALFCSKYFPLPWLVTTVWFPIKLYIYSFYQYWKWCFRRESYENNLSKITWLFSNHFFVVHHYFVYITNNINSSGNIILDHSQYGIQLVTISYQIFKLQSNAWKSGWKNGSRPWNNDLYV